MSLILSPGLFLGADPGPLGFVFCQSRQDECVHNGEWFNGFGQYIGHGDLDITDLQEIKINLAPGEIFIAACEAISWKIENVVLLGKILEHARFVVTSDQIYTPIKFKNLPEEVQYVTLDDLYGNVFKR